MAVKLRSTAAKGSDEKQCGRDESTVLACCSDEHQECGVEGGTSDEPP
jgi:hypothetical protein